MKRSTAVRIIKGMALTIAILLAGIGIVIGVFADKCDKLKEDARVSEAISNNALKQVQDIEREAAKQVQELKDFYSQLGFDYMGEFKLTAYCTEKYKHICGTGNGITASGQPVQAGISVAVGDTDKFPYGTVLYIEGVGIRIVQDTGGSLTNNQIDIAVDTHEHALDWGVQQNRKVFIVRMGGIQ